MKLFLSSYRAGDHNTELQKFVGSTNLRVSVISNAKDYKTLEERAKSLAEVMGFLSSLGFQPEELDLREFFGSSNDWESYFSDYGAVWVAGGNTFVLRRALDLSGIVNSLVKLVHSGELRYGGESAGACIIAPTLTGVEYGDDPLLVPNGYKESVRNNLGLSLIDFHIVPHFHSEWAGYEKMINMLQKNNLPYETLTDNEVFLVDNQEVVKLR